MTVQTKFNIDQSVWFISSFYNTPQQANIWKIKISISKQGGAHINYMFVNLSYENKKLFVEESNVFNTEKELIEFVNKKS